MMTLLLLVLVGACFACQWLSSQTLQIRVQGAHIVATECWTEVLCSVQQLTFTALCVPALCGHKVDYPTLPCLLTTLSSSRWPFLQVFAMLCYAMLAGCLQLYITSLKARFVGG